MYDNASLTSLDKDIFDGLTNLTGLEMGGTGVTALDKDIFEDLTSLQILRMTDNNSLTSLDKDTFDGLTKMWELRFGGTALTSLDEDTFDGLTSLVNLEVSNTSLTSLDEDIFEGAPKIKALYLGKNSNLTWLPDLIFKPLTASAVTAQFVDTPLTCAPNLYGKVTLVLGTGKPKLNSSSCVPARVQTPTLTAGHQRLVMDWYQPSHNAGPVTDYGVQYRQGSSGDWTDWTRKGAATANLDTLTGLTNGASYQARRGPGTRRAGAPGPAPRRPRPWTTAPSPCRRPASRFRNPGRRSTRSGWGPSRTRG